MKTVCLPVHPVSRKIILTEYGAEPLNVDSQDVLWGMLQHNRFLKRRNRRTSADELTAILHISVDKELVAPLLQNAISVGIFLYKYHRNEMCRYTWSQNRLGAHARQSILEFFHTYDINEDDLALESAYKVWQRWKWKKCTDNSKNPVQFFDKTGEKVYRLHPENSVHLNRQEVEAICEQVVNRARAQFLVWHSAQTNHLWYYTFKTVSNTSFRQTARMLGVSKNKIQYACESINSWAQIDPKLRAIIDEVRPTLN
jgi:hypothetical protein